MTTFYLHLSMILAYS